MKIGYVFECGPDGGDMKVFRHLNSLIMPNSEFFYSALSVKTTLLQESGKEVKRLKTSGCEKIFIVWDLYPAWRENHGRPCRKEDKAAIKKSLEAVGLTEDDVIFLCLEEELEAWLIADGRVLSQYFSRDTHKVTIKSETNPDLVGDPKGKLTGYFKKHKGRQYEGTIHAEQIIKSITNFQKLKKSDIFKRFHVKLCGNEI